MKFSGYILSITIITLLLTIIGCAQSTPQKPEAKTNSEPIKLATLPPGIHQLTVAVPSGNLLRYTISIPPKLKPENPVPLIIALHYGYSGKLTPFYGGSFVKQLVKPAFEELDAVIIAPDVLSDGDWTTQTNEQAVVWLTQIVLKLYPVNPKKVLITGFSMGAIGTWYIGKRHQDLFTAAIPVGGKPVDGDLNWTIPVYVIHSKKDEILPFEPTQKYVEKLKANGANIEFKIIDNLTHYETSRYVKPLKETQSWLNLVWK
ncbi:MAG TPA: dienelactone hydrolase family protein [Pyrinomonadaceae bacterium]|jgi:predicted peptidase